MSRIAEYLAEQFHRWELRGRGLQVFDQPVALEPPFRPFVGHFLPPRQRIDDGRRHTRLSGFMEQLRQAAAPPPAAEEPPDLEVEPEPNWRAVEPLTELQLTLPVSRAVPAPVVETFIRHVCRLDEQLALEILGTARETIPQFVAAPNAATRVERALGAAIPGMIVMPAENALAEAWAQTGSAFATTELGLAAEFMVPLGDPRVDLLSEVVTALETLNEGELGLLQVLFEPAQNQWEQSILTAVTDGEGRPFFIERPELLRDAERKISSPLFGVVFRLAAAAEDFSRCWEIIADMAAPFSALSRPGTNYLTPFDNEDYSPRDHEEDILNRQSRRGGMLLNLDELIHFLALPTASRSRLLRRDTGKSKPVPEQAAHSGSLLLGVNRHAGVTKEVRLSPEQRVRHTHIIGTSGTGKSTLLYNLIRQDIETGQGVAVLDPHGDLIDKILGIIPKERVSDVVLIDPADEEYSIGFNVLAAHSDFERNLLSSDLVSVFQRLSTSWGDQMNSVMRNAILAFLESTEGGTLADLRRFLLDTGFRNRFLATVTDPEIVYYWEKAFPQLSGNKSVGPVVTRLDEFLARKPIRHMVSQKENRVNFADVLDGGRILLAKLSQGLIGRENSYLLGSLLLSKIQQIAMSRQRMRESERRDFWCYVDEFPSFITPSMAEILTGARKYRVGLTLAHQELRQLRANDEVAGAVATAFTMIAFRVGDADARTLENAFSHFEARDLQNLEKGHAICRIEKSDFDFNLSIEPPGEPPSDEEERRDEVIAASRARFGRLRADIDAELHRKWQEERAETRVSSRASQPFTPPPPKIVQFPAAVSESPPASIQPEPIVQEEEAKTVSGEEKVASPATAEKIQELGRGGEEHQSTQRRLKEIAQQLGFTATTEKKVLGGRGSIDLALEKEGNPLIACEINVTSDINKEVGNVRKCLRAEYPAVAVICSHVGHLARLKDAVKGSIEQPLAERVSFFTPEEFIVHLEATAAAVKRKESGKPKVEMVKGYKVKRKYVQMSPEEIKAREEAAQKVIADRLCRDTLPDTKQ